MTVIRLIACLLMVTAASSAQEAADADLRSRAQAAFDASDWARAAELFGAVTGANPDDGAAWRAYGYALHAGGDYAAAAKAHRRTTSFPALRAVGYYNLGCAEALLGDTDAAFAALAQAVAAGFDRPGLLKSDSDLASLRGDARFAALEEQLVAQMRAAAAERRQVAIVVHEGVELLDFAGPYEVFEATRDDRGQAVFSVFTVSNGPGPVSSMGLTITPHYTIENCPAPDVLVLPGGGTAALLRDDAFLAWVRRVAPETEVTLSVCTGALVLARTGLLDGLAATTHHSAIDSLRNAAPQTRVQSDRRWVDNGRYVTAAGISAGIDAALHVVSRLAGAPAAQRTARYMEYRWQSSPERTAAESAGD